MLKSLLFDFNGVIVNDEPLHAAMLKKTLENINLSCNRTNFEEFIGYNDRDTFHHILSQNGIKPSEIAIRELIAMKTVYYCKEIIQNDLFLPKILDFIKHTAEHYDLGLVSGALRHEIQAWLQKGGVLQYFKCIVAAEDVQKGKPNPEGYLKALDMINQQNRVGRSITTQECLVIEDSVAGIQAAHAAGMRCAALTSSFSKELLHEADWICTSVSELRAIPTLAAMKQVV